MRQFFVIIVNIFVLLLHGKPTLLISTLTPEQYMEVLPPHSAAEPHTHTHVPTVWSCVYSLEPWYIRHQKIPIDDEKIQQDEQDIGRRHVEPKGLFCRNITPRWLEVWEFFIAFIIFLLLLSLLLRSLLPTVDVFLNGWLWFFDRTAKTYVSIFFSDEKSASTTSKKIFCPNSSLPVSDTRSRQK